MIAQPKNTEYEENKGNTKNTQDEDFKKSETEDGIPYLHDPNSDYGGTADDLQQPGNTDADFGSRVKLGISLAFMI